MGVAIVEDKLRTQERYTGRLGQERQGHIHMVWKFSSNIDLIISFFLFVLNWFLVRMLSLATHSLYFWLKSFKCQGSL